MNSQTWAMVLRNRSLAGMLRTQYQTPWGELYCVLMALTFVSATRWVFLFSMRRIGLNKFRRFERFPIVLANLA